MICSIIAIECRSVSATTLSAMEKSLSSNLGDLFQSTDFSDVTIEVGIKRFPAHKAILSARLPYFKQLFESGTEEAESGRVQIKDAPALFFEQVLEFLYTGKPPKDIHDNADSYLPIADEYKIEDLKDACCDALTEQLSDSHADIVDIMILAHDYDCADLKKESISRFGECKDNMSRITLNTLIPHPHLMLDIIKTLSV